MAIVQKEFGLPVKLVNAIREVIKKDNPNIEFKIVNIDTEEDNVIVLNGSNDEDNLVYMNLTSILEELNPKNFCSDVTCPYMDSKTFDARHEPCIGCILIPDEA